MRLITVLIIVLTLLVVAMAAGYVRAYSYYHSPRYDPSQYGTVRITDVYDTLKPGDVLLFISSLHCMTTSVLMKGLFSHAAILVRHGGDLWLSESSLEGSRISPTIDSGPGTVLVPPLLKIKHYTGVVYLMRLARPLTAAQEARLGAEAARWRPYPLHTAAIRKMLWSALGGRTWGSDSSRHCFQHVATLLEAIGLYPDGDRLSKKGYIDVGLAITELAGKPLHAGNVYEEPVRIVYDA
ncbi:MAG: hypothetical protein KGL39_01430 [Patescibacteria group bacterium]|nr:hypothetical protein [Patescibacteria group bacterium]